MGPEQLAGVMSIVARQAAAVGRTPLRRGGRRRAHQDARGAVEAESLALLHERAGSTTTASSTRATPGPCSASRCRLCHSNEIAGTPRLRRLPDVSRAPRCITQAPRRQPGRDRPAGLPHVPRAWASRPSRSTPTPTPTRRSSLEADEAVPLPAVRAGGLLPARAISSSPPPLPTGADAVHPGYGFLSENADFARACADGRAHRSSARRRGDRADGLEARPRKRADGRRPGSRCCRVATSPARPTTPRRPPSRHEVGYPVLVKASFGGGGRGMRVVREPAELVDAVASARGARPPPRSATAPCSSSASSSRPRHVEVQVFGDAHGTVVHLFERECSIQRRHQKIIEEAPSPAVDADLRAELGDAAVRGRRGDRLRGCRAPSSSSSAPDGGFFFLEVNTRLQVEHPVTELVTGLDLVRLQLEVAAGEPLPPRGAGADDHRPRHRGAALRRGRRRRLPARQRARCTASRSRRRRACGVDAGVRRRVGGRRRTTTRCSPR